MAEFTTATVMLWGHRVGVIAETEDGRRIFEFDRDFVPLGLDISPISLPLEARGPQGFPELLRSKAFEGLPGVFADSLPDAFGHQLILRYFRERGRAGQATPVQRLLYVGDRGPGALTYEPAAGPAPGNEEALEVRDLVDQARRVIVGDTDLAVSEIMRVGATAGGARPKALILWDREKSRVRSGHAEPMDGEEHWIIKFDGVSADSAGQGNRVTDQPGPWGRVEYVYSQMARNAGIAMSPTHLLRQGPLAHFMTKRFDRTGRLGGRRLHMHSLAGLLHLDYNVQYQIGYEDYFDTIRELGMGQVEVNEAFRRMVFSVATVNFDDHLKNFAFLMDPDGVWSLAPAYDVAYAENEEWTRQHQMSINGKHRGITRTDLLAVGDLFDVPGGGKEIIDEVVASVAEWSGLATEAGLTAGHIEAFRKRLQESCSPLSPPAGIPRPDTPPA